MRRHLAVVDGVVRLLGLLGAAMAAMPAGAVSCPDRPIKLAFFETPVLYSDGRGVDKDFVDALQRRSKCRFETRVMPRERVWKEFERGRLDMTTSVLPTPERAQLLWLFDYYQVRNYLILSKAQAGHIRSLDEFLAGPKTLVLGRVRGYRHGAVLDDWIGKLVAEGRVHDVTRTDSLYAMLAHDRIGAIVGSPMIYGPKLREHALNGKVHIVDWGGPSAVSTRALGLSKQRFSEDQAQEWRALVEAIQRDGTMRQLIGAYLEPEEIEVMLLR